ncbi:MAG: hypothetical protein ACRDAT_01535 [Cetobacterium sp.]
MFHITLTIKNVHAVDPHMVMMSFIKDVLKVERRPIVGYDIDTNEERIVFSAYFAGVIPGFGECAYFEARYSTDDDQRGAWLDGKESIVCVGGFTHITAISTTNCGDTFEHYKHEYPDSYTIPDVVCYQVLDLKDIPLQLPGFKKIDQEVVMQLYKDREPVNAYISTFVRTGVSELSYRLTLDTVTDLIDPEGAKSLDREGKYCSWLVFA